MAYDRYIQTRWNIWALGLDIRKLPYQTEVVIYFGPFTLYLDFHRASR